MSEIVDSTDSNVALPLTSTTGVQIVTPDGGITDVNPFAGSNMARVTQQRLLPSAVKGRNVALIQQFTKVDVKSAFVPTGASVILTTVTDNAQGQLLIAFPVYQKYVGNNLPANQPNNRMPEVITSSIYPFYSWESLYLPNGLSVADNPGSSVHKLQIRNNSGATAGFTVEIYTKFIVNNSNAAGAS